MIHIIEKFWPTILCVGSMILLVPLAVWTIIGKKWTLAGIFMLALSACCAMVVRLPLLYNTIVMKVYSALTVGYFLTAMFLFSIAGRTKKAKTAESKPKAVHPELPQKRLHKSSDL